MKRSLFVSGEEYDAYGILRNAWFLLYSLYEKQLYEWEMEDSAVHSNVTQPTVLHLSSQYYASLYPQNEKDV